MGLNTWQPIEVLISLRLHAGHGFHPVFLIGVIVAGNPHYLVFLVRSTRKSSLEGKRQRTMGPIECDWHSTWQDSEILSGVKW